MNSGPVAGTLELILFAGLGSFLLWARWTAKNRLTFARLSNVLERVLGDSVLVDLIELGICIVIGVCIAIKIVGVQTDLQALSAGMGWTGIVTQISPGDTTRKRSNRAVAVR
jgi:hypothetical protein